jgi:hypothetical protein
MKFFRLISMTIALSAIFGLLAFFYLGFFFPDPHFVQQIGLAQKIVTLWGIRIVIPLFVAAIILIFFRARKNKKLLVNFGLAAGTTFLMLLLLYPLAELTYSRLKNRVEKRKDYHPYLQLAPTSVDLKKKTSTKALRIFCIGGSTTEFKAKDGHGWPKQVQALLNKRGRNKSIQMHNQGRQWYTSLHSLINYETNLKHESPDVVIVMHAINDLLHNADFSYFSEKSFRNDYGHFYGPVTYLVQKRGLLDAFLIKIGHLWYHTPRKVIEQYNFSGLVPFQRNLNTIIDLAKMSGTKVVLMTQPNLYKKKMSDSEKAACYMANHEALGPKQRWSIATAARGMARYNEATRNIALKKGVHLIDLEKKVPKTLDYFSDDVHYTEKTFELIAKVLADELGAFLPVK